MQSNPIPITDDQPFAFSCSRNSACFNDCCRDLNQLLTPYDILRLKNALGVSSGTFLERYTRRHTGPESGLPVVTLKPQSGALSRCPFVRPSGCSVYEDRPSSCRMYPLMRIVSKSRESGRVSERYLMIQERHCLGFKEGKSWTVTAWQANQGLGVYNEMNDLMMDVISLKNRLLPGPLDPKLQPLFYMALYDLDGFKNHIFEQGRLRHTGIQTEDPERVKNDDSLLLKFGFSWIRQVLRNA